jgi:hypothetical protein
VGILENAVTDIKKKNELNDRRRWANEVDTEAKLKIFIIILNSNNYWCFKGPQLIGL